jgi:hypothetical protein
VSLATRAPVVLAVISDQEPEFVYIVHSLTVFPTDVTATTTMDGRVVGLIGDDVTNAVPVVLSNDFFTVPANAHAEDIATIQGPTGHGAVPPVFITGPHAAGTANTHALRARPAMILPCDIAGFAIAQAPVDGRFTLLGFYNTFLQGPLASPDAATVLRYQPLSDWWRLASTARAAGGSVMSQALANPVNLHHQGRLARWCNRVRDSQLARLGAGGPGLSNAAFAHGVQLLRTTMEDNHTATLEFERNRSTKSFTEHHGDELGLLMQRLCNVTRDEDLPPIHALLVKAGKGRAYGVLAAAFQNRATASPLPLTSTNAPLPTTKLVEEVFRQYAPGNDGREFGKGLSPFAIVCPGHEHSKELEQLAHKAAIIEAGTATSLSDATTITSHDVRFPTQPFVAIEKLQGWSVVIDIFHGVAHPIAAAVRNAVLEITPWLMRLANDLLDTNAVGMEQLCRVMFDMQQDYFSYLAKCSNPLLANPPVPMFDNIIRLVTTSRTASLATLPTHWYLLVDCPKPHALTGGTVANRQTTPAAMRVTSQGPTVNAHADRTLLDRYKSSGHSNITTMLGGRGLEIPKHAGKPVCLAWALKGSCAANCKRASEHVRYNKTVVQALHALLDACGVANPQP